MGWDAIQWGQFVTLLMIAFALGMDAFSLGIGMGMQGLRLKLIAKISLVIGLFHFIMPLLGIWAGHFLSAIVGSIATFVGGAILLLLGVNMLWNSFVKAEGEKVPIMRSTGWGLFLFALSVSLDALSVGFSFGLFEVDMMLAVGLFGLISMMMAGLGLLLGRHVGGWMGEYGEALGGLILLAFGIKFLV